MKKGVRDSQIEFARLIACMIVVMTHVNTVTGDVNEPMFLQTIRKCMLADGVPVFWMIAGMFMFNGTDYGKKWKSVIKKVLIPTFFLYVIAYLMSNFLYAAPGTGIFEGLSVQDFFTVFLAPLLSANHPSSAVAAHTWYVIAYFLVMLFLPLIKLFVDWLDVSRIRQVVFGVFSFALLVFNDITYNHLLNLGFSGVPVLIGAYIMIIDGHILYKYRHIISHKIFCLIMPIAFVVINYFRAICVEHGKTIGEENYIDLTWWTTSFSVLTAICIIGFSLSVINAEDSRFNRIINYIASYTFGIYLLHPLVVGVLYRLGYFDSIVLCFGNNVIVAVLLSILITFLMVFAMSFIISWTLRWVINALKKIN